MLNDGVPRRVVPRWRSSWLTATTPEAKSNRASTSLDFSASILRASDEFEKTASVPVAAELMFVASQANDQKLARIAANAILLNESSISSSSLINAAKRIKENAGAHEIYAQSAEFVRSARRLLNRDYNNPVLLMDVALALTGAGQSRAALRFVKSAISLAPQNRFVLRCAVRYFLHVGEKEQAHRLLLASGMLVGDPWIQASEIAVASVLGKTSKNVKRFDKELQLLPTLAVNFSELGSAIATVHLTSGSDKRAKKLFSKTLAHPTDNTVAQAEWAARKLGLVVPEVALLVPFSYEANSAHNYRQLDIEGAISQAKKWKEDEPFASRPVEWLGHLHAVNEDFERASEYYQMVLSLEREHQTCSALNLNFSRIETGALDVAAMQLQQLSTANDATEHAAQILANAGALSYALGNVESGRDLYQRAVAAAKARSDLYTEALVKAFFARAAVKYGDPQSEQIIAEAVKFQPMNLNPGGTHLIQKLVNAATRKKLEESVMKKVQKQQLNWDPKTNILRLS